MRGAVIGAVAGLVGASLKSDAWSHLVFGLGTELTRPALLALLEHSRNRRS